MICQRSTHTDQASQDAGACFAALTIDKHVAHILKPASNKNAYTTYMNITGRIEA